MKRYKRNALISLVLVFVFMALASGFNSAWGSVSIKDLYYPNANGTRIHAQLFVPSNVDADHPGPAILNVTPLILCLLAAQVVCPWAALYNGLN